MGSDCWADGRETISRSVAGWRCRTNNWVQVSCCDATAAQCRAPSLPGATAQRPTEHPPRRRAASAAWQWSPAASPAPPLATRLQGGRRGGRVRADVNSGQQRSTVVRQMSDTNEIGDGRGRTNRNTASQPACLPAQPPSRSSVPTTAPAPLLTPKAAPPLQRTCGAAQLHRILLHRLVLALADLEQPEWKGGGG